MVLGLSGIVQPTTTAACHRRRATAGRRGPDTPAAPVHLLLGTPSRGIAGDGPRRTHLVAWHLPDFADANGTCRP